MLILPDFVKFSSMADSVSASKEVDDCSCILCYRVIEKAHERYLVAGKSKFNAKEAIEQLPFAVFDSSPYICRQCLDKLRKRSSLLCQEKIIVTELTIAYEKGKLKKRQNTSLEEGPASKRTNVSGFPTPIVIVSTTLTTSLPHSSCSETTETSRIPVHHFNPNFPPVAIAHSTPVKEHLGMAASVLLRNRSPYMNTIQLMLGNFLYHSNCEVSLF